MKKLSWNLACARALTASEVKKLPIKMIEISSLSRWDKVINYLINMAEDKSKSANRSRKRENGCKSAPAAKRAKVKAESVALAPYREDEDIPNCFSQPKDFLQTHRKAQVNDFCHVIDCQTQSQRVPQVSEIESWIVIRIAHGVDPSDIFTSHDLVFHGDPCEEDWDQDVVDEARRRQSDLWKEWNPQAAKLRGPKTLGPKAIVSHRANKDPNVASMRYVRGVDLLKKKKQGSDISSRDERSTYNVTLWNDFAPRAAVFTPFQEDAEFAAFKGRLLPQEVAYFVNVTRKPGLETFGSHSFGGFARQDLTELLHENARTSMDNESDTEAARAERMLLMGTLKVPDHNDNAQETAQLEKVVTMPTCSSALGMQLEKNSSPLVFGSFCTPTPLTERFIDQTCFQRIQASSSQASKATISKLLGRSIETELEKEAVSQTDGSSGDFTLKKYFEFCFSGESAWVDLMYVGEAQINSSEAPARYFVAAKISGESKLRVFNTEHFSISARRPYEAADTCSQTKPVDKAEYTERNKDFLDRFSAQKRLKKQMASLKKKVDDERLLGDVAELKKCLLEVHDELDDPDKTGQATHLHNARRYLPAWDLSAQTAKDVWKKGLDAVFDVWKNIDLSGHYREYEKKDENAEKDGKIKKDAEAIYFQNALTELLWNSKSNKRGKPTDLALKKFCKTKIGFKLTSALVAAELIKSESDAQWYTQVNCLIYLLVTLYKEKGFSRALTRKDLEGKLRMFEPQQAIHREKTAKNKGEPMLFKIKFRYRDKLVETFFPDDGNRVLSAKEESAKLKDLEEKKAKLVETLRKKIPARRNAERERLKKARKKNTNDANTEEELLLETQVKNPASMSADEVLKEMGEQDPIACARLQRHETLKVNLLRVKVVMHLMLWVVQLHPQGQINYGDLADDLGAKSPAEVEEFRRHVEYCQLACPWGQKVATLKEKFDPSKIGEDSSGKSGKGGKGKGKHRGKGKQ